MRKFLILAFLSVFLIAACKKDNDCGIGDKATITGYDMRKCMCCGGYMIEFDNQRYSVYKDFYLTAGFPDNFDISIDSKFPIRVRIVWQVDETYCDGKFIKIKSIRKL